MKKLVLMLALVSSLAQAGIIAITKNDANGLMVLTDVKCSQKTGRVIYSEIPGANTIFGCWFADELMVHVEWSTGDTRSYPISIWQVIKKQQGKYDS